MTTLYSNTSGDIYVAGSSDNITKTFPTGTYTVKKNPSAGYYLSPVEAPPVPSKIYGDHQKKVDRIINTWKQRDKDTGVLLSGLKGSGKTLIIKLLANELAKEGVSTIYINENHDEEEFITFINAIEGRHIIVFDEYEKVFGYSHGILTLLDGLYAGNRLYLFSVNSMDVSSFLVNRPGRIYYHWKFNNIPEDEIVDFCNDRLNNKDLIEEIVRASHIVQDFNFDILSAIVEESNRYSEKLSDILSVLNVTVETDEHTYYKVLEFKDKSSTSNKKREIDENWLMDRKLNLFKPFDLKFNLLENDVINGEEWFEFSTDELDIDKNGNFHFEDKDFKFVLKKSPRFVHSFF